MLTVTSMEVAHVLYFMFLGLLGGVTYVIINIDGWEGLTSFDSCKRYVIGIIVGFLYDGLYSDYNFPNFIMCWVAGYMGISFIEGLINKFTEKEA